MASMILEIGFFYARYAVFTIMTLLAEGTLHGLEVGCLLDEYYIAFAP